MNDLLNLAVEAHGGLAAWNGFSDLEVPEPVLVSIDVADAKFSGSSAAQAQSEAA